MQKTRKRSDTSFLPTRPNRRQVVAFPEIVSIDVLGTVLDEDLIARLRALDDDRNKVMEAHGDPSPWEVEIAYVRREQQMRRVRRDSHTTWLKREEDLRREDEADLPPGDFDNSAFVYAATGGRPRWN